MSDDDELEGCDEDDWAEGPDAVADHDLDGVILFADIDPADVDAIEARVAEYEELFGV